MPGAVTCCQFPVESEWRVFSDGVMGTYPGSMGRNYHYAWAHAIPQTYQPLATMAIVTGMCGRGGAFPHPPTVKHYGHH